ncbi:MAG TPA: N-acetylmuramoyl-L-alanine amidase [Gaiellaceae bacterium]|nr:N-acetylmuramoyl-L-alanine amidase [Gaiellaceae bacterium]
MRRLVALTAVALAYAAPAHAMPAQIATHDVPLAHVRAPASAAPRSLPRFNLVGLHWQGPGTVDFRTRSVAGRWSAWRPAAPEDGDRPDGVTTERSPAGWNVGSPWWTGASDRIEYRLRGDVRRLRAHFVWSPVDGEPPRAPAIVHAPPVITRQQWGANELIKRGQPSYADRVRFAVVHHTAGTNEYSREQSAAIVRGIQLYHVQGNGWNDIGYNFLVDKYGQVFEGRFGGLDRNVVGAHAEGFNTGSTGVALLGNHGGVGMTAAARDALVRLLAWRLDVAHVDPLSTFNWTSAGNAKFPRGRSVALRSVVGHRDVGFSECPGTLVYGALDDLARRVAQTGLPKLYDPVVSGRIGAPVRFTARLSSPLPWVVTVTNGGGQTVATGSGNGAAVDWTWDATSAPPGSYSYSFTAGPQVRPATGSLGTRPGVLSITAATASPAAITPNGDGVDDATTVAYTLGIPATVTATLVRPDGTIAATLFSEARPAGPNSFALSAESVPDGTYTIVLRAVNGGGREIVAQVPLLVSRTLAAVSVAPTAFSPNGDKRRDVLRVRFSLTAPAVVRVRILTTEGKLVATPLRPTPLDPGIHMPAWDGSKRVGRLLDGEYRAEVTAIDAVGAVSQALPLVSDTRAPVVRFVSLRPLRLWVSEPAEVVVVVGGRRTVVKRAAAGTFAVPGAAAPGAVVARAWDPAANVSRPVRARR